MSRDLGIRGTGERGVPGEIVMRKASPFRLREQLLRSCWCLGCLLLFRPSPRPWHLWRRFLLRVFGAKVSGTAHIYPAARIWAPWNLEVGEVVGVADGVVVYNQGKIILEDYVTISQEAFLCTGSHDYTRPNLPLWTAPITVRKNAWVAARAFIHPGVTIGRDAVVGACAVVTRDVGDGCIVAGNPATVIKRRIEYDANR